MPIAAGALAKRSGPSPVPFLGRYCPNPRQSGDAPLRSELELPQMKLRSSRRSSEARRKGAGKTMMHRILSCRSWRHSPLPWRRLLPPRPLGGGKVALVRASAVVGGGRGSLALVPVPETLATASQRRNLGSSGVGHGGASFSPGSDWQHGPSRHGSWRQGHGSMWALAATAHQLASVSPEESALPAATTSISG